MTPPALLRRNQKAAVAISDGDVRRHALATGPNTRGIMNEPARVIAAKTLQAIAFSLNPRARNSSTPAIQPRLHDARPSMMSMTISAAEAAPAAQLPAAPTLFH